MTKIQIILGSTRPGRVGQSVADWAYQTIKQRDDIEIELVDVADYNLPLLDEPLPASSGQYSKEHTKNWSAKIAEADGYIFVTPEYNHSVPGALKNAVDFLYNEWTNKAVGFISYGSVGGARSVEAWRLIVGDLQMADIRNQLMLFLGSDFENMVFKPTDQHAQRLNGVVDQVKAWAEALKPLRQSSHV